jgi:hypothetical protein
MINANTTSNGTRFELWVCQLYRDLHYSNVQHHEKVGTVVFDVVYTSPFGNPCCVECKYTDSEYIGPAQVGEFIGNLQSARVRYRRGYMLTNKQFTKEAHNRADSVKLTLLERPDLVHLDYLRQGFWDRITHAKRPGLEEQIRRIKD